MIHMDGSAIQDAAEPTRRRLTFSLRAIFFVVTCAAVFFAGSRAGENGLESVTFGLTLFMAFLTIWSLIRGWKGIAFKIGLTLSLFLLAVLVASGRPRIFSRRVWCLNNLREIGAALTLYDARYGHLPHAYAADADGKPLFSWRGILLNEIGRADFAANLHAAEAWNGAQNRRISNAWLSLYECPSDIPYENSTTSYFAVVGAHTAWPTSGQYVSLDYIARHKGLNKTILLIEVHQSNINWLDPRDITIDQLKNGLAGLIPLGGSSPHPEGFNVLFADGHVETLPADIDPKKLNEMCNIDARGNPP
jgi:prepilin-type processing-associated H-X9-DG protein